ncbi:MAG: hypothetical protein GKR89_02340 [Candidatus Latescibacteria bacterium]|nr:hypothetical protein [Candidatus Latescibacterota bacterium]
MQATPRPVRVAIYGTGRWANRTHLPNLRKIDGVEIVGLCDAQAESLQATAQAFGIERTYADGQQMLDREEIDILYSVVPAFARTDVEARAAAGGVHLFSEKPQARTMAVARRIDRAVQEGGVLSTVCFRERYRPLFQEARRLLADKEIIHVRFQSPRGLPGPFIEDKTNWHHDFEKAGGGAFDWGVHAVDYTRFMTGLNLAQAQAFYHHPPAYNEALSCAFNLRFTSGATMSMNFTAATPVAPPGEPPFTIFFAGGYLALWQYDRLEINGEVAYRAEEFDPWFEQDRLFVEAVQSGDDSALLNDYHDGLYSLAPVLAGWESARQGGVCIDIDSFMEA